MSSTVQPRFEHVWPTAPGNPPILMGPCSSAPDSHLASQLETDGTPDFKIYHYYNGFTAQFAKPRAIHSALESSLSQCSKLRVYWLGGIWSRHLCFGCCRRSHGPRREPEQLEVESGVPRLGPDRGFVGFF
jgi:hypothetical protein